MTKQTVLEPPCETESVENTARILGVGRNAAYAAVQRGEIPSIKIGKLRRVPRRWIQRVLSGEA